jgi:hypothetical protein
MRWSDAESVTSSSPWAARSPTRPASCSARAPCANRISPGSDPASTPAYLRSQWPAADADLVVEVVSRESERRDRQIKPEEYAAAGIPEFWLVERHPVTESDAVINMYRLSRDGRYALDRTIELSALLKENQG